MHWFRLALNHAYFVYIGLSAAYPSVSVFIQVVVRQDQLIVGYFFVASTGPVELQYFFEDWETSKDNDFEVFVDANATKLQQILECFFLFVCVWGGAEMNQSKVFQYWSFVNSGDHTLLQRVWDECIQYYLDAVP